MKTLRDTGAFHSFIRVDVLRLSEDSKVGRSIPVWDMGLDVLLVPLHRVFLECKLFCGETLLAVRTALPIEGVSVILGNNLVSSCMWADVLLVTSVVSEPVSVLSQQDESKRCFSDGFTACAVTHSMAKDAQVGNKGQTLFLPLNDCPLPVSRSDLITEQRAVFDQVRPEHEISDSVCGYSLQELLLVRKWVPNFGFVENATFQS